VAPQVGTEVPQVVQCFEDLRVLLAQPGFLDFQAQEIEGLGFGEAPELVVQVAEDELGLRGFRVVLAQRGRADRQTAADERLGFQEAPRHGAESSQVNQGGSRLRDGFGPSCLWRMARLRRYSASASV